MRRTARSRPRQAGAMLVSAALLASLAAATVAAPSSAAKPKCQGQTATIVGTRKADVIRGTAKRDVIVAKGGRDIVIGKGGNDIICGGAGNDRLVGKAGSDRLIGGPGSDRLFGGPGPDRLFGGPGPDTLAGQTGNDVLDGGLGVDTCFQGQGNGPVVRCELPPVPPTLLPLTDVLAIAYSDIDGLNGYSTGDVLISRLIDLDGNGADPGDRIEMGRYPTNLAATAFGDWGKKTHVVTSVGTNDSKTVAVKSTGDLAHTWFRDVPGEGYDDGNVSPISTMRDGWDAISPAAPVQTDNISIATGSPSQPQTPVSSVSDPGRRTDDPFIDIVIKG